MGPLPAIARGWGVDLLDFTPILPGFSICVLLPVRKPSKIAEALEAIAKVLLPLVVKCVCCPYVQRPYVSRRCNYTTSVKQCILRL